MAPLKMPQHGLLYRLRTRPPHRPNPKAQSTSGPSKTGVFEENFPAEEEPPVEEMQGPPSPSPVKETEPPEMQQPSGLELGVKVPEQQVEGGMDDPQDPALQEVQSDAGGKDTFQAMFKGAKQIVTESISNLEHVQSGSTAAIPQDTQGEQCG